MTVKEIWTESDFEDMGWHDSYLYAVHFPEDKLQLKLDIDYLFKWELNEITGLYKFWVSPCSLIFHDVLKIRINFDFSNSVGVSILEITRSNPRVLENGKITLWDYSIDTDRGMISFESSGYIQNVNVQPTLRESQVLGRG